MDDQRELADGLIFPLVLIVIAAWFYGPAEDAIRGQLTAYPVWCAKDGSSCRPKTWVAADRIVFTVLQEQQGVVAAFKDAGLKRLKNCVVMDRKNWHCPGWFRVADGVVHSEPADESFALIPRWRWYSLKYLDVQP